MATLSSNFTSTTNGANPSPAPHGTKRAADTSLEGEQRLSKRLDLLHLENGSRLYLPVPTTTSPPTTDQRVRSGTPTLLPSGIEHNSASKPTPTAPAPPHNTPIPPTDSMQIDNTPHRIYIADLDAELAELSTPSSSTPASTADAPIFLPDIERHLSRLPRALLRSGAERERAEEADAAGKGQELVLYGVPQSLSVPAERDGVRRAILEARARARERGDGGPGAGGQGLVPTAAPMVAGGGSGVGDGTLGQTDALMVEEDEEEGDPMDIE